MSRSLEVGSKAPDFSCAADGDRQVSLADFTGKKLVIYFYPKDDTPGCTTEAIEFTANHNAFTPPTPKLSVFPPIASKARKIQNQTQSGGDAIERSGSENAQGLRRLGEKNMRQKIYGH